MIPYYEKHSHHLRIEFFQTSGFPAHLHKQTELLIVLEGTLTVQIMNDSRLLTAGDCALIFPEQLHSYHADSSNRSWLLIFDNTMAGGFLHTLQKYRPSTPFISASKLPAEISPALQNLYNCTRPENPLYHTPNLETSWLQVILALLLPHAGLQKKNQPESMDITFRLVQYISEHFQEALTLDVLAHELHANKFYISHIFSDRFQMSFRHYLNHFRLDYAQNLIRTSDLTLTQIWAESGFNSQRSFNRAFLEIAGMTPRDYRKRFMEATGEFILPNHCASKIPRIIFTA